MCHVDMQSVGASPPPTQAVLSSSVTKEALGRDGLACGYIPLRRVGDEAKVTFDAHDLDELRQSIPRQPVFVHLKM